MRGRAASNLEDASFMVNRRCSSTRGSSTTMVLSARSPRTTACSIPFRSTGRGAREGHLLLVSRTSLRVAQPPPVASLHKASDIHGSMCDIVEADEEAVVREDHEVLQALRRRPGAGGPGVDEAAMYALVVVLARALLSLEGEDRVGTPRRERDRRHEVGSDEGPPLVVRVR